MDESGLMLCSFLFSINLSSVGTECMERKQSGSLLIPKQLFFTCLHVYFYSHDRFDLKKQTKKTPSALPGLGILPFILEASDGCRWRMLRMRVIYISSNLTALRPHAPFSWLARGCSGSLADREDPGRVGGGSHSPTRLLLLLPDSDIRGDHRSVRSGTRSALRCLHLSSIPRWLRGRPAGALKRLTILSNLITATCWVTLKATMQTSPGWSHPRLFLLLAWPDLGSACQSCWGMFLTPGRVM